jgi:hypothetical protein
MFLSPRFRYRPFVRALKDAPAPPVEETVEDAAVIFVHAEDGDDTAPAKLRSKFIKNVKWLANKRGVRNIVLHSFTHLSESKAEPGFAERFLTDAAARLESAGYRVHLTPFGYSCEWELAVHGEPIAKVFKAL